MAIVKAHGGTLTAKNRSGGETQARAGVVLRGSAVELLEDTHLIPLAQARPAVCDTDGHAIADASGRDFDLGFRRRVLGDVFQEVHDHLLE